MLKNTHLWLPNYFTQVSRAKPVVTDGPTHIMVAICDHFEPKWGGADQATALHRVQKWHALYPPLADAFRGYDGVPLQYTFFYPAEEYEKVLLDYLAEVCQEGIAEVEIHIHHDNATEDQMRDELNVYKLRLIKHGLLGLDKKGARVRFGFIHGNWALDNARPDGRWCGLNNELDILRTEGCYADFTMPSAPDCTQTSTINSIYYALENPEQPKSHDTGIPVRVGASPEHGLMMIQGPLALNWRRRKAGLLPRIENGELTACNPPTPDRVDLWVRQHIHVTGKPEWVFIKLHTHGAQEANSDMLLAEPMEDMLHYLEARYNDGEVYQLHYVTARQMYNIVKAAESGETGDPHAYRDYNIVSNIQV